MEIHIKQQNRKSFAMRITPSGDVVVQIPHWIKPNSKHVKKFIKEGLKKLEKHIPDEKPTQLHEAETLRELTYQWAEKMGVDVGRVQFRNMTRKWGSCSTSTNITLNKALFYVPLPLAEYVIVHELVHLLIFDHSPAFWAKVGEYIPDYETRRKTLNEFRV